LEANVSADASGALAFLPRITRFNEIGGESMADFVKQVFEPVGLARLIIEIIIVLVAIFMAFGNINTALALHSQQIMALQEADKTIVKDFKECDTILKESIKDSKIEREKQLDELNVKLDKIYDLLLKRDK